MMFMLCLGVIFLLFAPWMVQLYGAEADVAELATVVLRISAFELPFLAICIVLFCALRGAGDTRSPLYASLVGNFVFRLGMVHFFTFPCKGWGLGWGLAGAWCVMILYWGSRSAILWWIFKRGSWKRIHEREKARDARN